MNKLVNGQFVELTSDEVNVITAEETKVKDELAKTGYKQARATLYPPFGEQLDLLYHAIEADSDLKTKLASFYNAIKAVKDANPKPS